MSFRSHLRIQTRQVVYVLRGWARAQGMGQVSFVASDGLALANEAVGALSDSVSHDGLR